LFKYEKELDRKIISSNIKKYCRDVQISYEKNWVDNLIKEYNDWNNASVGVSISNYPFRIIVIDDFDRNNNRNMNTLSHELLHYTLGRLNFAGINHCEHSEETFTYFHGYLMEQVLNEYDKLN